MAEDTMTTDEWLAAVGSLERVSDWLDIPQSRIDAFADATLDPQFIHVDAQRAAQTPFSGTIAHGFLTLSLLVHLSEKAMPKRSNLTMGINYGFDKIRFLNPVPSGARIRGRFKLIECVERRRGEYLSTYDVTVEIEGQEKPAMVATWLGLAIMEKGNAS